MPPPFDDDLVSPELALVDPELAARARAALPDLALQRLAAAAYDAPPAAAVQARWRERVPTTPVLTLLATAAASLIITAFTGLDQARGEASADAGVALQDSRTTPTSAAQLPGSSAAVQGGVKAESSTSSGQVRVTSGGTASPAAPTAVPPANTEAARRGPVFRTPAAAAATLVWARSPRATSYDVELVRGDAVIFSSRSLSSRVVVPRSWQRDGVTYRIQPEDRAFVWAVANGQRDSTPVVDGALALDLSPVVRFFELNQG